MAKAAQAVEDKKKQQESPQEDSAKQAQSAEFPEVNGGQSSGPGASINILLEMNVPVTVAIGRTQIPVRRLLQLGPGSVLKLGKPVDEPVDLYLKDTKFATGTVVVVDNRFAVKIKQIHGMNNAAPGSSQN
jgi:flagellar motor switch protein FliN/FliY